MTIEKQQTKTQTVAFGWQLVLPENTVVTDNEQGNIVISKQDDSFRGGPVIMLKVDKNEVRVDSCGYFDNGISITLDKKIIITVSDDFNTDD